MPPQKRHLEPEQGESSHRAKSPRLSQGSSGPSSQNYDPSNRDTWQAPTIFDDEFDIIDLTQADEGPAYELYASLGWFY